MNENEVREYMELSDKADKGEISYEDLTKLNKFHQRFLQNCYCIAKESQKELEESEALIMLLTTFIDEQDIEDEFKEYLNTVIEADEEAKTRVVN